MANYFLEEFNTVSKSIVEDRVSDNMFDYLSEYTLCTKYPEEWEKRNKSNLDRRRTIYGVDNLRESSLYSDLQKYSGLSDTGLLNSRFRMDDITKEFYKLKSPDYDINIDNVYIKAEKRRIEKQKESKDYKREDHFAIGTVYLNIPPTQISISDEKHNFRYNSMRSKGETIASSGHSTTRIDLDIFFNGLDDINNKLRPLLAQFKTIPFLPIENEYIKNVLNPFGSSLVSTEGVESKKNKVKKLEKAEETVQKLLGFQAKKDEYDNEITVTLRELKDNNLLTQERYTKLAASQFRRPDLIPPQELTDDDYRVNDDGMKELDFGKYLRRLIATPDSGDSIMAVERSIKDIEKLQNEIELIRKKSNQLHRESVDERYDDRQIAGVLSQLAISTVPGFPETLACRLSMYVFNYEPFSEDFAFISGDKKEWTPDITQCDLFIDWYTKRFLSSKKDSLHEYNGNDKFLINYIKQLNLIDKQNIGPSNIDVGHIEIADGINITGITISFRNIIQFLPILSHKNPTCQYMGSYNTDVQINMQATSIEKVNEFNKMIEKIGTVSRQKNKLRRHNFLYIENEMLQFCGMKHFVINSNTIDTVPDNPGLYELSLSLSEYILDTQEFQKLKRVGITNNEEIKEASLWILEEGHKYALDPEGYPAGKPYYDLMMTEEGNWLIGDNNAVVIFTNGGLLAPGGVGGGGKIKEELRQKIKRANIPGWSDVPKDGMSFWEKIEASHKAGTEWYEGLEKLSVGTVARPRVRVLHDTIFSREKALAENFVNSFNNGPDKGAYFEDQKHNIASVLSIINREKIIMMIRDTKDHIGLHKYLTSIDKKKEEKTKKSYCYPDLELPKYEDLSDGLKYMINNKTAGLPGNPDESIQEKGAEVDPDFFFYKGKLWDIIDNNRITGEGNGVNAAIFNFKMLIGSDNYYKENEALSDNRLAEELEKPYGELDISEEEPDIGQDDSGKKLTTKELDEIQGKELDVIRVIDGDTFVVRAGGKEENVRLLGINTPEAPKYDKFGDKTKEGEPGWEGARDKLVKILMVDGNKKVVLSLGSDARDQHERVLAQATTINNNTRINVTDEMFSGGDARKLNIKPYLDPNNPLTVSNENAWYKSRDLYILTKTLKEPMALRLLKASIPALKLAPAARFFAGKIGIPFGPVSPGEAVEKFDDYVGVLRGTFVTGIPALDEWFRNWSSEKPENRFGYYRFDRKSTEHVDIISYKIRESQKDDIFRINRAFPTFKIYFIEEDMPEWGLLDDLYEYNAVQSIDVIKSRKEAADTAVIRFLNTEGNLDTTNYGDFDKNGKYFARGPKESMKPGDQETEKEQTLNEFILKSGTRIKIKMGYSSDPDLLDTVFTGMVAEVTGGDVITTVAQGYGVELLRQVKPQHYDVRSASAFKILDKVIQSPEVTHFGHWSLWPRIDDRFRMAGRRPQVNPKTGEYRMATTWRNIGGIRHLLRFKPDPRSNNINYPEQTYYYDMMHGSKQSFITQNKTIWDIFQDMSRRMPGYIATVLPFDNRATIFFGPADFMYWFTDEQADKDIQHELKYKELYTLSDKEKFERSGFKVIEDVCEIREVLKNTENYLNYLETNHPKKNKELYYALLGKRIPQEDYIKEGFGAKRFLRTTAVSGLNEHITADYNKIKANKFLSEAINDPKNNMLIVKKRGSKFSVELKKPYQKLLTTPSLLQFPPIYCKNERGYILTISGAIKNYENRLMDEQRRTQPSKKLVRAYHFKDSIHHVIANNIIASDSRMYNKITVEFGRAFNYRGKEDGQSPSNNAQVSCQADDDIWPEKIREKRVPEKNARDIITAWGYGLGNLWLGMRDMYTGHLTVLGDPSIKPYDFVFLSDYFTDMHGPVEVEQVTHHFSPETGFVTTIVPDLVCYVNDILQMGSTLVAGAYMDELSQRLMRIRRKWGFWSFGLLSNTSVNLAFNLTGFDRKRREPIAFTPLLYNGRPFLAGVQGLRKSTTYEAIRGWVYMRTQERAEAGEALRLMGDKAVRQWKEEASRSK